MLTLGIDDAGRGPVAGPMVLAGCVLEKSQEKELKKLGVKDSKMLTPLRRGILAKKIKEVAKGYKIVTVSPEEIDGKGSSRIKLNEIEGIAAAKIINALATEPMTVVLDCPSTSLLKWRDFVKTHVNDLSTIQIACEHKADKNHVAVSAASILAKEKREEEMTKLRKKYGQDLGSGYTSDPLTQKFLEKNVLKLENEGLFRKSWETFRRAKEKKGQKTL